MSTAPTTSVGARMPNRWLILAGGVLVQLAIGAVYAWSVFAKALQAPEATMRLTPVEASLPFQIAIGMIFVGSFVGGKIQDKRGPRLVAIVGVVIYAIGICMSALAREPGEFWLLLLGYGVLSGFGLGLAYIVPIAMLQKWFPDKVGLVTGLAVGGFGFGAVITSPLASNLIGNNPTHPTAPFLPLGLAYLVAGLLGAAVFANPPAGYTVAGAPAKAAAAAPGAAGPVATRDFTQREALSTPQWYLLTLILTLSVTAGISLISVAAGAASSVAGFDTAAAAGLVGILGLFNGGGRILWAWVSDKIGKMRSFVGILGIQGLALLALPHASSAALFVVLAAVIYTCYGGGFGTMPSTAGRFFGVKEAGGIYGLMLVGWSIGGIVGPLTVAALAGSGEPKNYTFAFTVVGIIALVGALIPLFTRQPARPTA